MYLLWFLFYVFILLLIGYIKTSIAITAPLTHYNFLNVKSGDMVFCLSNNFTSKIQKILFGTPINHCCMILKLDNEIYVWDCSPRIGAFLSTLDNFLLNKMDGESEIPESPPNLDIPYTRPQRKSMYRYSVYIRRLNGTMNESKIHDFVQENIGRPYSYRFWPPAFAKIIGIQLPLTLTDTDSVFCSELIALTYKHNGFQVQTPEAILPVHFWENTVNGLDFYEPEQIFR